MYGAACTSEQRSDEGEWLAEDLFTVDVDDLVAGSDVTVCGGRSSFKNFLIVIVQVTVVL